MDINDKLLDQLIAGDKKPVDPIGENGLLKQLIKRLHLCPSHDHP